MNLKKLQNLFDYPAINIYDSYVYTSDRLYPLKIDASDILFSTLNHSGQIIRLSEFLNERKISPKSAIVSYGANASLKYLQEKTVDTAEVVPVIQTVLHNYDVVYAAYYCSDGTIPATLVEKQGACVNVFFSFISDSQLEVLNVSENLDIDYQLATIDPCDSEANLAFLDKLYYYECLHGPLCIENSQYSMAAIQGSHRSSSPLTQYEIQRVAFNRYFKHDNFYDFCMENIQCAALRHERTLTLKRGY